MLPFCRYSDIWLTLVCDSISVLCYTDSEERTYGGCEGPDAMYVKLISSDGHEFIVKREHALTSGTIKAMLSGPGKSFKLKKKSLGACHILKKCFNENYIRYKSTKTTVLKTGVLILETSLS